MTTRFPALAALLTLHLLQRAEARFGNGDLLFTAEEQVDAFTAAEKLRAAAVNP